MDSAQQHLRESSAVDLMRLDILMQYYPRLGCGIAGLKWSDPLQGGPVIQAHLVALLYGHILYVHKETREELFVRVGKLARQNVDSKGAAGFAFAPWQLHTQEGRADATLWPWQLLPPEQVTSPRIYTAILKHGEQTAVTPSGRWLQLEVSSGEERILLPASALIAIAGFSQSCDLHTRYLLARLLWQMNHYWGTPYMIPFYSETLAYASAVAAIRSRPFGIS